jgi:hypothetical protein
MDDELPLFKDERVNGLWRGQAIGSRARIEKAEGDASDAIKMSIPLVPPVKGGARLESQVTKIHDREVSIHYRKDRVTISLSQAKKPMDENQLKLFDFDLN